MRLRDLRWYMLAGIVLIISYAAVAFCYYLPIRAKAESSMKVLGQEATVNVTKMAEDKLNSLYDSFLYDSSLGDSCSEGVVESSSGGMIGSSFLGNGSR